MDKNLYLNGTIKTYQLTKEEALLAKYMIRNNEVKEALEGRYGGDLYSPFNSGSYAKNTAINTKFDFDLVAPFKRNSFGANGTLKEMFDSVYDFLYETYKNIAEVKKQKVSIGIAFYTDSDGDVVKIDVVPGRELNQNQYTDDKNLNLYVYYKYGNIEAGSERIKTNVQSQISNIKDRADNEKESIRKIIRLLKVWKYTKYEYPTKSFLLELITLKAFDNQVITGNLWERLKMVLEYIKDNIADEGFSLKDPGNTSNDLAETLTKTEKENFATDMKNLLDRIEDNAENIKTYFPENIKFKEDEESKEGSYKSKGNSFYSVPPKNERFG